MGMIVEGVSTTKAAYELAQQLEVEMPITETIYNVLYNDEDVQQAAKEIMLRDGKTENEFTLDFRRKKMKVKKAVIPAAGLGTRFLPATKAMAKEMLPIVDKPTIQFIVEEALASGIEDILIVTGKAKRPIEDHFDSNVELENNLKEKNKTDLLKLVEETTDVNLHFIRQSHPKGLGHAVLQAKAFVGNEPFVVMLGDDLMEDKVPLTKQLMDDYEQTHASTIAVMKVPHEDTSKYGIINPEKEIEKDYTMSRILLKTKTRGSTK